MTRVGSRGLSTTKKAGLATRPAPVSIQEAGQGSLKNQIPAIVLPEDEW